MVTVEKLVASQTSKTNPIQTRLSESSTWVWVMLFCVQNVKSKIHFFSVVFRTI